MKSMEKTQNQKLLTINEVASSARKGVKRRRREFKKIHIPNDIVEEIMVRFAVKSLMRFQAVSKHWRSLITSKDFGERHRDLEQSKECKLLLVCNYVEDYAVRVANFSLKTVALGTTPASVVDEKALKHEIIGGCTLCISESCDGLVCLYDIKRAVKVVNPATKMCIELPLSRIQQIYINMDEHQHDPDSSVQDPHLLQYPKLSFSQLGFGKDNSTGRHKPVYGYIIHGGAVFANGSLYWLTGDEEGYATQNTKLIVFDIHTEMFQAIPTPPFITDNTYGYSIGLCNLHGRLCISELGDMHDKKQEFWWRVTDNTWEKIFSVHLPSTYTLFDIKFGELLTPLAICRDTNRVILSLRGKDKLVALDLNPHSTG